MIHATAIMLNRAEGPIAHTGKVELSGPDVWAQAERQLAKWRVTAGRIGYDKTDFVVTFADGETYTGCYLLGRFDSLPLAEHIRGFLRTAVQHGFIPEAEASDWQATYSLTDNEE